MPRKEPARKNPKVYVLRQRAALFGHNAPDWRTMSDSVKVGHLTCGGLYAEYFGTKNLTKRKVTRIDPVVDFDWDTDSRDDAIGSENFSARWTGFVKPPTSGSYTFRTDSDDGVRLWVDGKLIIDDWTDHAPRKNSGTLTLAAESVYAITLEYYQSGGGAIIQLLWSRPDHAEEVIPANRLYPMPPDEWPGFNIVSISDPSADVSAGTGLRAEYYDRPDFKNRKLTRVDPQLDFDRGSKLGLKDTSVSEFSARWTGWVRPKVSGAHTFHVVADDKVRLWVDGSLVIDNWRSPTSAESSGEFALALKADHKYGLRLEYGGNLSAAKMKLQWSTPDLEKEIIPKSRLYPCNIHLDAIYPQILADSWLVLSIPEYQEVYSVEEVAEDSRTNFSLC